MHVGKKNIRQDYFMKIGNDVQKISVCETEKDLGVTFDSELSFDLHIKRVTNKANQMIGIIKRTFLYMNKHTFLMLYKAFVRPHLEYASVVWNPYLIRQSKMIENVQRRATRLLTECKNMSYEERLKFLQLHSLKGRRVRGDLIQVYKIVNGMDKLSVETFFSFPQDSITRNAEGKIFVKHRNTNIRGFCFSNRIVKLWNKIPLEIKFTNSINKFKNFLDDDAEFKILFKKTD